MPTTACVSRRLNILCIMFKIIAFFLITLFALLYMRGWHSTDMWKVLA